MLVLLGVVVVVGFALRLNPMVVVTARGSSRVCSAAGRRRRSWTPSARASLGAREPQRDDTEAKAAADREQVGS